jgi:type I restriction enzyme S subunit
MFALQKPLNIFNGEGTVFGSINKDSLNTMQVIIPPVEVLNSFETIVKPIDTMIENNYYEVCNLQEIRDSLLPKLMSGEIRVPVEEVQ